MTRVPTDGPDSLEPARVAERLADMLRRQVLAAAQAGLRAVREVLAKWPAQQGGQPQHPTEPDPEVAHPKPPATEHIADTDTKRSPLAPGPTLADPPPAALLRSDAALPVAYGSNRLVLLVRDPHCLYAYWDLTDARLRSVQAQAKSDQLRIVLRAYDVTQVSFDASPPTRFQDFAVAGDTRSIYAYLGKPAACFVAEVGFLRPDGAFFPLARSLPVWTPRTDQPGASPGRWMTVGRNDTPGAKPPQTTSGSRTEATAAAEAPLARRAPSSWPESPHSATTQHGSWSLVRGKLATATSPGEFPVTRSEP